MNSPVYNGAIFSSFFTDQNLAPILNKNHIVLTGHVLQRLDLLI